MIKTFNSDRTRQTVITDSKKKDSERKKKKILRNISSNIEIIQKERNNSTKIT